MAGTPTAIVDQEVKKKTTKDKKPGFLMIVGLPHQFRTSYIYMRNKLRFIIVKVTVVSDFLSLMAKLKSSY